MLHIQEHNNNTDFVNINGNQLSISNGTSSGDLGQGAKDHDELSRRKFVDNLLANLPKQITISELLQCDTKALAYQIAGHSRTGVLKHKLGHVLKPFQKEPLGSREVGFYTKVYNPEGLSPKTKLLQKFLPNFYGVVKIQNIDTESGNSVWNYYIALQDLVEGFSKPCVIDVKIGAKTWDPCASPTKVEHEKSKYIGTKEPLGLSLTGMQYYSIKDKKIIKLEKEFGKSLDELGFVKKIEEFLNGQCDKSIPGVIARKLVTRLKEIQEYFEVQRDFSFYSSSLLVGYDADRFDKSGGVGVEGDDGDDESWLKVWMIDFAHVFPIEGDNPGPDSNYQFGLCNLVKIFEQIGRSHNL